MISRSVCQQFVSASRLRAPLLSTRPLRSSVSPGTTCLSFMRPFHASPKAFGVLPFRPIVPQPPGNIVGTVNEAVPVPESHKTHGSYHWTMEKAVSIALVPLAVAPFFTGSGTLTPMFDAALGSFVLIHAQMGLESCIVDYIPKREWGWLFGASMGLLYTGTIVGLIGLYEFETNDIGITGTIKKVWNA